MTRPDLVELARQLLAVLALVESGELPAEAEQVEFLRGAVATLFALTNDDGPSS